MSLINDLLKRLNRVFNKSPQAIPAIQFSLPVACRITIGNMMLTLSTACGSGNYDLSSGNIQDLVENLNTNSVVDLLAKDSDWYINRDSGDNITFFTKISEKDRDGNNYYALIGQASGELIAPVSAIDQLDIAQSKKLRVEGYLRLPNSVYPDDYPVGRVFIGCYSHGHPAGHAGATFNTYVDGDTGFGNIELASDVEQPNDATLELLSDGSYRFTFTIGTGSRNHRIIPLLHVDWAETTDFGSTSNWLEFSGLKVIYVDVSSTLEVISLPGLENYAAAGLLECSDLYPAGETFFAQYPTSLLYKEFQVYARMLQEQAAKIDDASKQVQLFTATDSWLDDWWSYFKVERFPEELDADYNRRAVRQVLRPNQNNIALQQIIRESLNVQVRIDDAVDVYPSDPLAPGRFAMEITHDSSLSDDEQTALADRIMAILKANKAGGTDLLLHTVRVLKALEESVGIGETLSMSVVAALEDRFLMGLPVYWGVDKYWGDPDMTWGADFDIIESIRVLQRRADNGTTVFDKTYGG